jgi:hypothetical protein
MQKNCLLKLLIEIITLKDLILERHEYGTIGIRGLIRLGLTFLPTYLLATYLPMLYLPIHLPIGYLPI